eukprot:1948544-Prymnesium_polylepis.1
MQIVVEVRVLRTWHQVSRLLHERSCLVAHVKLGQPPLYHTRTVGPALEQFDHTSLLRFRVANALEQPGDHFCKVTQECPLIFASKPARVQPERLAQKKRTARHPAALELAVIIDELQHALKARAPHDSHCQKPLRHLFHVTERFELLVEGVELLCCNDGGIGRYALYDELAQRA